MRGRTGRSGWRCASRRPPPVRPLIRPRSARPPSPARGEGTTLGRFRKSGWGGRGTAGPRPVFECFTVSTRQAAPRGRYPLAPPAGGPSRASPASRPLPCGRDRKAERADSVDSSGSIQRRAASKQRPSIDLRRGPPDSPPPGLHRSTTARRHRERGSDALPTDGMPLSYTRPALRRVQDAVGVTMWRENRELADFGARIAH